MTHARRMIVVAIGIACGAACASPTVTLATEKPIEIKIDLHHEVRVRVDREVDELIESEEQPAVTTRSGAPDDDALAGAAKARGVIGEEANGYLGLRTENATAADHALVQRVNASRRDDYVALAKENGAPLAEIEKAAAASRIAGAAVGEWVRTPEGEWLEKTDATVVVVHDQPDA